MRLGARLQRLNHHRGVALVQPLVPIAHREMLIDADIVFARLAIGGGLLVGLVVGGVGIDTRFEQDGLAVRPPFRALRPGRNIGDAARLAALGQVEHIDLRGLVTLALGREGDRAAVRRPGDTLLRRLGAGQAARRRVAVGRHQPQIADRLVGVIGRFEHREHHLPAIGADHRGADPLHHPQGLVGDRLFRRFLGQRSARHQQNGQC